MTAGGHSSRAPSLPPPRVGRIDDADPRAHVQTRLALFTRLWCWVLGVAFGLLVVLYEVQPASRPPHAGVVQVASAIGVVVLGGLWFFGVHRGRRTLGQLYAIDAIGLLVLGALFGTSAYLSSHIVTAPHTAFIWHTFVAFSRSAIVPSPARRTAVLTGASYLPLAVAAVALAVVHPDRLAIPPVAFASGAVVVIAVAVILATTGSYVIYGLRRQVTEALQLGQYTLGERIGAGGMGVVYRARHALLRRPTAIKLLPVERSSDQAIGRFEREVQHLSRLTHPNTVQVFDYGRTADGVFYFAMEYLDGIDLERLVSTHGPMPAWRAVHVLAQVCGSLAEAHAVGLVHRDVKPANVILCRRGLIPDVVKIVDFGLAQEVSTDLDADAPEIVGTPAYLAPEAVTDARAVDARADLYAVGAVAYYLVSGARVFDARSTIELLGRHATEAPEPPSRRTANAIPRQLEELILACLAKDPAARPASARQIDRALAKIAEQHPWDEAAATAWWDELDARRADAPPRADEPTRSMTVDLKARGDHAGDTDHAT
jgi:eukaryotic-like serine/threonine-protein kinase